MSRFSVSKNVIGCAIEVHKTLGCGFLETVYQRSLAAEFSFQQLEFQQQFPIDVEYKGLLVGQFVPDFIVADKLIVEIKASKALSSICEAQLINYLHASGVHVGLLTNFGTRSIQVKRMVNKLTENMKI